MLFTLMIILIYSSVDDFNLIEFINDDDNNNDLEEIIPVATEESDFFEENRNDENKNNDLEFLSVYMDKSDYFEENMIVEDVNNHDNILETPPDILSPQIFHVETIKNGSKNICNSIENPDIFERSERILKELMSKNINDFVNNSYCEKQIESSKSENIENSYISTDISCDKGNVQENSDFKSYVNYINDNNYNLHDIQIFDSKENRVEVIPILKANEKTNEILSHLENNSINASQKIKTTEIICTKNKRDLSEIHPLHTKKINGKFEYTLNLTFQNLSNIQAITFKDIQHLNLDNNNLVHIPNEVFNLHSLESLSLENNKIKNISEININLIYLKCSNNKINSFHIMENNLIYLIIDKNEIREFHLNFNFYKEIKTLDFSKNKIIKFTIEHPDKSKLMRLDLSDNEIKTIEENIKYLNLELLDLRNNKLNNKSANIIISMKNLKYLDLKGNNIECLRTIESKTLLFLNISKNPVVILHRNFFDMPCIRHIFMSGLTISLFPSLRKSMDNLTVLDMSYTEIITLPYGHDSLVNLEFLNLSNCRLEYFPEGINIKKLKKLNLSNNDLKNLHAKFRELKDKQIVLDLRNNPLDYFSDKRKLGVLDLLEIFYNKILLDDKIYDEIRNLPFKSIDSQRSNFEIFKFEQLNKVVMKNEHCLHYLYPLLNGDDPEIKNKVIAILAFAEKIRTSGFL
ncbi:Leucine rich repeat protein, partial [Spraguea lophii 42_110]